MKRIHMKIISLVILTALLVLLAAGLTVATVSQLRQQDIEFSGTFI